MMEEWLTLAIFPIYITANYFTTSHDQSELLYYVVVDVLTS